MDATYTPGQVLIDGRRTLGEQIVVMVLKNKMVPPGQFWAAILYDATGQYDRGDTSFFYEGSWLITSLARLANFLHKVEYGIPFLPPNT